MIIKKISLLGIVLFSVFSQSFCMEPNVTGTSDKKWKKINVRHALAEQWKFDSSFDNDLRPALRDYTRHRCSLNIMLAGACVSVALVGAVVVLKTSWYNTGCAVAGLASLFSAKGIYRARSEHKKLGILNKENNGSQEYEDKITAIGRNALYKSIQETNIEQPKGELDVKKLIITNSLGKSLKLDKGINKTVFEAILSGNYNNSKWTLMQEE